jgi:hypothetical protein
MVSRWIEAGRDMQVVGLTGAFKPTVERRNLYRPSGRDGSARNRTRAAPRLQLVGAPG